MKVVYKIYVGEDRTNCINYFGSADGSLIARDFTLEQRQSFTVMRDILWWSETASRREISLKELEFIRRFRSNDPAIGYNRWPPLRAA